MAINILYLFTNKIPVTFEGVMTSQLCKLECSTGHQPDSSIWNGKSTGALGKVVLSSNIMLQSSCCINYQQTWLFSHFRSRLTGTGDSM